MKRIAIIAAAAATGGLVASAGEMATFGDIDTDANGTVSQEEFVAWKTADGEKTEQEATDKFTEVDANYDGEISEAEYDQAKAEWEEKKSDRHDMEDNLDIDTDM
jgi:hypothetical protein